MLQGFCYTACLGCEHPLDFDKSVFSWDLQCKSRQFSRYASQLQVNVHRALVGSKLPGWYGISPAPLHSVARPPPFLLPSSNRPSSAPVRLVGLTASNAPKACAQWEWHPGRMRILTSECAVPKRALQGSDSGGHGLHCRSCAPYILSFSKPDTSSKSMSGPFRWQRIGTASGMARKNAKDLSSACQPRNR